MQPKGRDRAWTAGAIVLYAAMLSAFVARSCAVNGGHLVYPLDDSYIHLAIARNAVEHGTFGTSADAFASASSSPLWSALLILCGAVAGFREATPLALNAVFGVVALLAASSLLRRAGVGGARLGLALAAVVLLTPLVPLSMSGMEHTLHLAACFWMLCLVWDRANDHGDTPWARCLLLAAAAATATAARYETLFLAACATTPLLSRGRLRPALAIAAGCAIPVLGFGAYLLAHGDSLIPNTLLLKGRSPDLGTLRGIVGSLGYDGLIELVNAPHLHAAALCLAWIAWRALDRPPETKDARTVSWMAGALAVAILLHLQFASTGWFFRYEAYLVALSLAVIVAAVPRRAAEAQPAASRRWAWVAAAAVGVLLVLPAARRSLGAHAVAVAATSNVHGQQYQMGRFIDRYYRGVPVAANDVGALSCLGGCRTLDLMGLGSSAVAKLRRSGSFDTAAIRDVASQHGVRLAVVYPSWFTGGQALPSEWIPVGTWAIPDNVVCGSETVTFLAVDPDEEDALRAHLREFATELPDGVVWSEIPSSGSPGPR